MTYLQLLSSLYIDASVHNLAPVFGKKPSFQVAKFYATQNLTIILTLMQTLNLGQNRQNRWRCNLHIRFVLCFIMFYANQITMIMMLSQNSVRVIMGLT